MAKTTYNEILRIQNQAIIDLVKIKFGKTLEQLEGDEIAINSIKKITVTKMKNWLRGQSEHEKATVKELIILLNNVAEFQLHEINMEQIDIEAKQIKKAKKNK